MLRFMLLRFRIDDWGYGGNSGPLLRTAKELNTFPENIGVEEWTIWEMTTGRTEYRGELHDDA